MKLISKALRIARVKGITQFYLPPTRLSTNGTSHPTFTPSRTSSPHFGRYSFPYPQKAGGWIGLSGWLHTEVVRPPRDGHPSQYQIVFSCETHCRPCCSVGHTGRSALRCVAAPFDVLRYVAEKITQHAARRRVKPQRNASHVNVS